jgi:hypothetical protein
MLTIGLGVACASALAQGTLSFANFGGGANAPIFDTDGTTKLGNTFQADLYWAPGIVPDSSLLAPLRQPATFRGSGYFIGGVRTIPGQEGGATITAQVRVWNSAYGSSWEQARFIPGSPTGESLLFLVVLTSLPYTPASLTGLQSFSLRNDCLSCSQPWPVAVTVQSSGPNGLLLSWPAYINAGRYKVQQNPDLNRANWVTLPDQPVLVALPPIGTPEYQIALPNPAGNMFYRLVWQ